MCCGHHRRDKVTRCRAVDNKGAYKRLSVQGERVDAVVRETVALIKMDVEGFEPHVLDSAKGLFDQHLVDDVRPRPSMLSVPRLFPVASCASV